MKSSYPILADAFHSPLRKFSTLRVLGESFHLETLRFLHYLHVKTSNLDLLQRSALKSQRISNSSNWQWSSINSRFSKKEINDRWVAVHKGARDLTR